MGKRLEKNPPKLAEKKEVTVPIHSCHSDTSWTLDKLELVPEQLVIAITMFSDEWDKTKRSSENCTENSIICFVSSVYPIIIFAFSCIC